MRGELVHVLHVQGSSWGGAVAVNLGIHLRFLPVSRGRQCSPRDLTESECFLRRRMSEADGKDQWWRHERDEPSIRLALEGVLRVYTESGRKQFESFGRFPEAFGLFASSEPPSVCLLHGFHAMNLDHAFSRIRLIQQRPSASPGSGPSA